ncbi:MAG: DUF4097 family beta strand repeat-containing protein [Gemmatimonadales bacterium]
MRRPTAALLATVLVSLALCPSGLSAQRDADQWLDRCDRDRSRDDRYKHCEVRETGMRPPRGTLTIDPDRNGGVAVTGWERDSVAVFAKIQTYGTSGDAAAALAREIKIEASGSTVRVSGPGPSGRWRGWSVSFEVYVPRRTDLSLKTENGPIGVSDVVGRLDLDALNGPVSLDGVGGNVRARVQNGPLHIELVGTRWEGEGMDVETVNGPVDLAIPEGYNARVEFGTVNGPMSVGFPLNVTIQGRVTQRITTTMGSGGPLVRVVTTNGPFTLRRGGGGGQL